MPFSQIPYCVEIFHSCTLVALTKFPNVEVTQYGDTASLSFEKHKDKAVDFRLGEKNCTCTAQQFGIRAVSKCW